MKFAVIGSRKLRAIHLEILNPAAGQQREARVSRLENAGFYVLFQRGVRRSAL